jgi:hypothetical protein
MKCILLVPYHKNSLNKADKNKRPDYDIQKICQYQKLRQFGINQTFF